MIWFWEGVTHPRAAAKPELPATSNITQPKHFEEAIEVLDQLLVILWRSKESNDVVSETSGKLFQSRL